ncbi:MAG: SDR family oxidoreductase [Halovenus sp.]
MSVVLTGFPGFLGVALTERLLARGKGVTCLVQPRYLEVAQERAAQLQAATDAPDESLRLVTGDITEADLALAEPGCLADRATELYHLAALYDLGVDPEPAAAVNVRGTERVLEFAARADVERLHYVSTCYVSGRYDGLFGPTDLDVGQRFNNHYEETKFRAEIAVKKRLADGLPATVYRPAITTGDSETGATDKYDGLYYLLDLLARQRSPALAPVHPPSRRYEFNVVPRDFVVAAIDELAARPGTVGETYQLCNPNPPTVRRLVELSADALGCRVLRVPVHARTSRYLLERVPHLAALFDIEPAALDYLAHPTRYVSPNTRRALADTAVTCPPLSSYLDRLVAYRHEHPDIPSTAMA